MLLLKHEGICCDNDGICIPVNAVAATVSSNEIQKKEKKNGK